MDAQTRAKYEAWKWNRIKRRVIFPSILVGLIIVLLIVTIVSCEREEEPEAEVTEPSNSEATDESDLAISLPLVYLFNSHPLEMVGGTEGNPYVGEMDIIEMTHQLADLLDFHGVPSLVETRNVDQKLQQNNWEFDRSFYAAREFVFDAKAQVPSLEFFIDLHRDGIAHRYATVEIDGITYARIIFVIGSDNPNGYEETYYTANQLHQLLEQRLPGISRGMFLSGGVGRDGIYGQDISPRLQLIEVGTYTSTVEEVERTLEILAEVLADYLLNVNEN